MKHHISLIIKKCTVGTIPLGLVGSGTNKFSALTLENLMISTVAKYEVGSLSSLSKNRTAQLVNESFYCALALTACIGSTGFFDMKFTSDFYIYFTNICNYLCAGIIFAELVGTVRKNENSFVSTAPRLRFISMLGIVLTFIIFNALLAHDPARDPALNYKVECILCHIILPVLYVADWILFYEHGKVTWRWPLLSMLFPLLYLAYLRISIPLLTGMDEQGGLQ